MMMNKEIFLNELKELLKDLPLDEREEALQYYEAYFDDAGIENEAKIIEELESPAKVAAKIKAGLSNEEEDVEYTEKGYNDNNDEKYTDKQEVLSKEPAKKDYNRSVIKIVLIVIFCILAFPAIISIGGSVLGVSFGAFGIIFGLVMGVFGLSIGAIVGGVVTIITGATQLIASPATGIFTIGAGLLILAFGMIMTALFVNILCRFIPWLIRTITGLFNRLFSRKGVKKNEENN